MKKYLQLTHQHHELQVTIGSYLVARALLAMNLLTQQPDTQLVSCYIQKYQTLSQILAVFSRHQYARNGLIRGLPRVTITFTPSSQILLFYTPTVFLFLAAYRQPWNGSILTTPHTFTFTLFGTTGLLSLYYENVPVSILHLLRDCINLHPELTAVLHFQKIFLKICFIDSL